MGEREKNIDLSFHLCVHSWVDFRTCPALTRDRTRNRGLSGWCSDLRSSQARPAGDFFQPEWPGEVPCEQSLDSVRQAGLRLYFRIFCLPTAPLIVCATFWKLSYPKATLGDDMEMTVELG